LFEVKRSPNGSRLQRAHGEGSRHLAESVRAVAVPIVRSLDLELVDVQYVGQGSRSVVRVFIDKPGGVNLDDCEQVHISLGHALDVADPIPHSYRLEVSSPGLDRPLKNIDDYRRSIGRLINLKLRNPFEGQWRVVGRLIEADNGGLTLACDDKDPKRIVRFEWAAVAEGRLEVEL
jgi:ribosome maturation factor RimP